MESLKSDSTIPLCNSITVLVRAGKQLRTVKARTTLHGACLIIARSGEGAVCSQSVELRSLGNTADFSLNDDRGKERVPDFPATLNK
jgi:hypothetical protein